MKIEKALTPCEIRILACRGVAHLILSVYLVLVICAVMLFFCDISAFRLSGDFDRRLLSMLLHTTVQLALSSGDSTRSKPSFLILSIISVFRSSLR